ncbi:MAG: hypothetical protein R3B49_07800 [Phycisphaerales bacterium]
MIEVNGVTSEATVHYDPDRSAAWAWGVLRGQWTRLYDVAEARSGSGREGDERKARVPGGVAPRAAPGDDRDGLTLF